MNFPKNVLMLRGNHECRQMTSFFNFKQECEFKYDEQIYDEFMKSFDALPISCLVNDKFLAVHGGISPELKSVYIFHTIIQTNSLLISVILKDFANHLNLDCFGNAFSFISLFFFSDLLWADPVENEEGSQEELFKVNEVRGCSFFFGYLSLLKIFI
jgi:serine/threonine-protein phosphatase 2B catalytic subunit